MNKVFKALNGHKSAIGATINLVLMWAASRGMIPEEIATLILSIASAWTGIAVGHNLSKIGKAK